jgi:hypothetical protein
VNVRVNAGLTPVEQEELDGWIRTRGSDLIHKVLIEAGSVTLYGNGFGHVMSAMTIRYPGRLVGALDEAFAALHNTP